MERETNWMDRLSLVFSLLVIGLAAVWTVHNNLLSTDLIANNQLSWYITRASGITAYILLSLSVIWGLVLSSNLVKNWSPGPLSMILHSTLSWLGLLFAMGHGLALLFDTYFTYHITDIVIPFTGPYRPYATGLGILAFWLLVIITPSFALKKRLFSYRAWKTLHYTSYAAFLLATAHGLTAGTDAQNLGFRLMFGLSVGITVILLSYRLSNKKASKSSSNRPSRPAARVPGHETP